MGRFTYKLYFLLALLFCAQYVAGQGVRLSLMPVDAEGYTVFSFNRKNIATEQQFNSMPEAFEYLRKLIPEMQEEGFLAASIDSLVQGDTLVKAWIFRGASYKWARLSLQQLPKALLNDIGLHQRDWENKVISPARFAALSEKLLTYCENNGYPFAATALDHMVTAEGGIHADLVLERGSLIRIDTLIIDGDVEVSRDFLQSYLGIHQGDVYNESQLRLISKKLKELPFLQEANPWKMDFTIAENKLKLYIRERKANQLNGLIGLQPNTVETGKFMLTADVQVGLKNALGYGETIALTYLNMQYKSPRFHVDLALPYLFGTPFGLEGSFDLFKKDTTFVRVSFEGGIRYQLNASDYVKLSYQSFSNRIVNADVQYVQLNKRLPDNLDIGTRGAGVEFLMDRTDYKLNPRKGWQARVGASGLLRNVKKNDAIVSISDGSGFNYEGLYDTLNQDKYQYRFTASAGYYIPLGKSLVLKVGYSGGYLSGSRLFLNELYQIGGFKLLRGFDEQSIYANQYHVGTLELRVLLGGNSYFYIFNDDAYVLTQYGEIDRNDAPVSLGTGITLENKSGIFNVAVGLGKHSSEPFQFRQTKIHFGYIAYF